MVICRVLGELVIQSQLEVFRHLPVVIGFGDARRAVVEGSVADGNSEAASRKELPMGGADAVDGRDEAYRVLRAAPPRPLQAKPRRGGPIHVGKLPGLVLAIAPTQAREGPEILADFLLQIDAKAVLVSVRCRERDILAEARIIEGLLIASHVRPLVVGKQAYSPRMSFR